MFRRERRDKILGMLELEGRVDTDDLATRFGVSVDSIRKDLQALAKEGKCTRVYGGAMRLEGPLRREVRGRELIPSLTGHLELEGLIGSAGLGGAPSAASLGGQGRPGTGELIGSAPKPSPPRDALGGTSVTGDDDEGDGGRRAVARRAYLEINDGDSVFLDVSRTNSMLADLIATGEKRLIVTTNMIEVLRKLTGVRNVTALGTGGYLNVQLNGFVGSATVSLLEPLLFSKAFIGASGIDLTSWAVTSNDIDSGSVKERVIHNASYKFLLADEGKFGHVGSFRFASLTDFSAIITDTNDPDTLLQLQRIGVPTLRSL